ncbi:segregation/condensation protein A [Streptomyces sp. NPDC046866]|uniref:segregation and condensation protein A n=1 Tax=Streptomyces sp. NPDC046866 TaxID=3154921 RepID=UPI00345623FE
MPSPAEPGRSTRRPLGRGPGVPAAPAAPDAPAERRTEAEASREPRAPHAPAQTPPGPPTVVRAEEPGDAPAPTGAPELGAARPARPDDRPDPEDSPGTTAPAGRVRAARQGDPAGRHVGEAPQAGPGAPARASRADEPAPAPDGVAVAGPAGESAGAPGPAGGPAPAAPGDGGGSAEYAPDGRFTLRLDNFEGPFDLLLQLISRHKLDVTEVALSKVTDEFMAHIRAMGPEWDLDQTTEFLVVAATLLDLKTARLLPAAEVEDEADLALLEARDLLFARLLQYRAYKQIAAIFEQRAEDEGRRHPRTVGLEDHHADLLPEVVIGIGAEGFARLAVKAMQPKAEPQVYVDHIHAPLVSVREQAAVVVALLKARGAATFQELTEDTDDTLTVVARFLALLELYREKAVALEQEEALRTLTVRWSGGDGDGMPAVTDEFDRIVEDKE